MKPQKFLRFFFILINQNKICIFEKTLSMRKFLNLLLLIVPIIFFSKIIETDSLFNDNSKNIKILNNKFENLNNNYEYQLKIHDQTLNSISSQIDATSFNLSIFAILFGILAIGLGIYVTWVERKIIKIREETKSLLEETKNTKNEVVIINDLIQKDLYGPFIKIKREETLHILKRLQNIPKDICNFSNVLLSRELKKEDYELLRNAFIKLKSEGDAYEEDELTNYGDSYILLFFQHFLDLATKDEEVNHDLIKYYKSSIDCSFENDITKSTEDFIKCIIDLGYQNKSLEINEFFSAINNSKFKDFKKVYKIFFDSLKIRDDQFKFYEIISSENNSKLSKNNYGLLLVENYEKTVLTKSEKNIIDEIKIQHEELERMKEERAKQINKT